MQLVAVATPLLLTIIGGWNDFKNGSGPNVNGFALMYVNTTTNLAASGLPATINEDTELDWSGTSNMLAYSILLIP